MTVLETASMFRLMRAGLESGTPIQSEQGLAARDWLSSQSKNILETQVQLARTPAPPFQERARAELVASKLGAIQAEFDEVGNLMAWLPDRGHDTDLAPIIIAAHVDTVFGPETPIEIRRIGDRWVGPGIVDNARGLAVTITILHALRDSKVVPNHPLIFAFTVGEEGPGDLRGVKHLLRPGAPVRDAAAFIAIDGSGTRRIIHHALGSRRFRLSLHAAGGHSWTDWGRVNPANALGDLIRQLSQLRLPEDPRTTLTVARLGGGTSINAIPTESWVEIDVRSERDSVLASIESQIREALAVSASAEESRRDGALKTQVELIGERPAGRLSAAHSLVQAAEEATRAFGEQPEHAVSSTDANVPLAFGIPSIAIGAGGRSGDTHTTNEWFEDTDGAVGALRALHILAATAGF